MDIFLVFLCVSLFISPILNEDIVYDTENGDETNELLLTDNEYNQLGSDLSDQSNPGSFKAGTTSKIDLLIASIRDSAVDILQDIGDLEDLFSDRYEARNTSKTTTNKYTLNDMVIPSKSVNVTKEKPKVDILEEGKKKLKIWEEQIKVCKSILDNSKLPKSTMEKSNLVKLQDKKKPNVIAVEKEEKSSDVQKEKQKRRRRKLWQESMDNLRQVYN